MALSSPSATVSQVSAHDRAGSSAFLGIDDNSGSDMGGPAHRPAQDRSAQAAFTAFAVLTGISRASGGATFFAAFGTRTRRTPSTYSASISFSSMPLGIGRRLSKA